jgi:hypothetical protein
LKSVGISQGFLIDFFAESAYFHAALRGLSPIFDFRSENCDVSLYEVAHESRPNQDFEKYSCPLGTAHSIILYFSFDRIAIYLHGMMADAMMISVSFC